MCHAVTTVEPQTKKGQYAMYMQYISTEVTFKGSYDAYCT